MKYIVTDKIGNLYSMWSDELTNDWKKVFKYSSKSFAEMQAKKANGHVFVISSLQEVEQKELLAFIWGLLCIIFGMVASALDFGFAGIVSTVILAYALYLFMVRE